MKRHRLAAYALAVTVACAPTPTLPTEGGDTSEGGGPPEEAATEVAEAIAIGDPQAVATLTDLKGMPWLALAEGATVEEAAAIDEDEAIQVAINFWSGFLRTTELSASEARALEPFSEGETNFARLELPAGSIVLNQGDSWQIDVIASFGASLAERLLGAAEVVAANRSPEADELREMLRGERDAVAVAMGDPAITPAARALVEEVLVAIDTLGS